MSQEQPIEGGDDRLGRVQSLVRAFALLDQLSKADGMTLSEIASLVKLPRSTAHRLLTTMEAMNFVSFDRNTNHWEVGLKAFTVGAAFAHARDLGKLGRPIMRGLMQEVHHSVNIAVPEQGGMCYVGQVEAVGVRPTLVRPGACLPMHTTAAGKVLMAHWEPAELDRFLLGAKLQANTERTIVRMEHLRAELTGIRERGFALDDEEHAQGMRCVAAVVLDRYGIPKASLSISDNTRRLPRDKMNGLGQTLVFAAGQITSEIASQLAA